MEIDLNWEIHTYFLEDIERYIAIFEVTSENLELGYRHISKITFQTENEAREYANEACKVKAQELESKLSELENYVGIKIFHSGDKQPEAQ